MGFMTTNVKQLVRGHSTLIMLLTFLFWFFIFFFLSHFRLSLGLHTQNGKQQTKKK